MEITALTAAIRAASDMAKGLKTATDRAKNAAQVAELIEKLASLEQQAIAAQLEVQDLLTEKRALAKKLSQADAWERTLSLYELYEVAPGRWVYARRENAHHRRFPWLCARCFEERMKSIMQCRWDNATNAKYECPKCKSQIQWVYRNPSPPPKTHVK